MSEDFQAEMPHPNKPQRRPTLKAERESEKLGVGSFFREGRAAIDERRSHLARMGMDATHVEALRMPTTADDTLPARGKPAQKMPIKE